MQFIENQLNLKYWFLSMSTTIQFLILYFATSLVYRYDEIDKYNDIFRHFKKSIFINFLLNSFALFDDKK